MSVRDGSLARAKEKMDAAAKAVQEEARNKAKSLKKPVSEPVTKAEPEKKPEPKNEPPRATGLFDTPATTDVESTEEDEILAEIRENEDDEAEEAA